MCGKGTVRCTSWTDQNLGCRFLSCKNLKKKGGCNFFLWTDPSMRGRSIQIIPGLLYQPKEEEHKASRRKKREKILWFFLLLSSFFLLWFWLGIELELKGCN
ncbi:hypothetical protein CDL12_25565 [Handroanthus impetiginosus]|uniref:Zinc finger GRF-type domain-containing protein n=1 Tax=Handroanthus impetiginosus TaxID=429701 RepID=A0A2G9G9I2_9LAMI|nr:hypothetical protein CDL12_25565 [Handroanthus impetiginosus]